MTAELQTVLALVIVAVAATWLVARTFGKQQKPGCGGGCGCPTEQLKSKLPPARRV
jgi:hypothetical protein